MNDDFLSEFLKSTDWQKIQYLFSDISGADILWVVSSSGKIMQNLEDNYPDLCKLIRKSPDGMKRCSRSHNARYQEVKNTGHIVVSSCFCGLIGFAFPLIMDNELTAVVGGCHSKSISPIDSESCRDISAKFNIELDLVRLYAKKITCMLKQEKQYFLNTLSAFTGMISLLMKWMSRLMIQLSFEHNYSAKISALSEIGMLAAGELKWEEMLTTITSKTRYLLSADSCSIYILDHRNNELVLSAVDGYERNAYGQRIKFGQGIIGYSAQNHSAVIINDIASDPQWQMHGLHNESVKEKPYFQSMIFVPLIAQERLIGVIGICNIDPKEWQKTDLDFLSIISVHVSGIIEKSKIHKEMSKELEVAKYIQAKLLPDELPKIAGYDIAAATIPHNEVGGDYYDFITIDDDHLGIIIADVCGKGIGAAILMANTRGLVHANALKHVSVKDTVFAINNALYESTSDDKFITLFYGILNTKTGTLTYVNAGHNYPYVYKSLNEKPIALSAGGIILGMMPDIGYAESVIQIERGDIVVFYSDGITEAQNKDGDFFGEERLHEVVYNYREKNKSISNTQNLLNDLYNAVSEFSSGIMINDDITVVILLSN